MAEAPAPAARLALALRARRWLVYGGLALLALLLLLAMTGTGEPDPVGGPPMLRRLTEAQYRNAVAEVFAPDIAIAGRFEKPFRAHGLIAVGTGQAGMSPFAVEQYDMAAQGIAAAVLGEERRAEFLDCTPVDAHAFDESCARRFLAAKGRLLFRRPLSEAEIARFTSQARAGAERLGDFHKGLELGLYAMLVAPDFLFRIERAGEDGRLDAFSRAERLAFFLTDAPPDDLLLTAAEQGELDSAGGIRRQAARLMDTPRFAGAVESFFADMLEFDRFGELAKDPMIYPAFNSDLASDAQAQTLRTITHHLLEEDGDYRDLFTTRDTFLTRALGVVYRTPVSAREGWTPVTFAADTHRAGIQSHVAFLALHSHPGRSSPTLRGYAVRQTLLCQEVPDPPATVNFTAIEAHVASADVTARDRLALHATDPSCAGCHKVMDPLGLGLEGFDGVGAARTHENGERISLAGELDGTRFSDAQGLAQALRDHPETPRCVAQRMYSFAVGRDIVWGERYYLDWLIDHFAENDYTIRSLMRAIATSENFYTASDTARPGGRT